MGPLRQIRESEPDSAIVDILRRLWQTKLRSISLIEYWIPKTGDFDIKTGLKAQLTDERRHLRLIEEELKRLGAKPDAGLADQALSRPFAIVQAQPNDFYRLLAYYYGIKAYTFVRCGHLIAMVDQKLAKMLEQIAREEQRHIRWADIRLERGLDAESDRQGRLLVSRIETALETGWQKPWRRLATERLRLATFPGA